ncbi:MAG: FHA domain-containing protein [Myxococcota bacterium]
MARLCQLHGTAISILQSEHLIGRGSQCNLLLSRAYVSTQHALIRWSGTAWELVDRGSRNGTLVDGVQVEAGKPYALELGSVVAFGHREECWQLVDIGPPQVAIVCLDTNVELLDTVGVIGVPSDDDPICSVYRDTDGLWKLEYPDTPPAMIEDGYTWEVAGQRWRFSCPKLVGPTATSETQLAGRSGRLHFVVSRDEEFVELTIEYARRSLSLGSRSHNYLLLVLARARSEDRAAGLSESSCGWRYKEDLADALRMTPQQVDGEVHRIRKHFGQHGLEESSTIIERRPRTKQLRLGVSDFNVSRA